MRSVFRGQLLAIEQRIGLSLDLAIATLGEVGAVVGDTAAPTPASIERNAQGLRDSCRELDELLVTTIARQAPVAGDLRLILVLLEIAHHCSRIANQFDLVTAQLMEIDPDLPDLLGTGKKLASMADLAGTELATAAVALRQRDSGLARRVGRDDYAINRLNREVFAVTLGSAAHLGAREVALRHVLIARSIERIGHNAVDIAERAVFLVTGEFSEFTDASRPTRHEVA
jgi:phosphate transport system protein